MTMKLHYPALTLALTLVSILFSSSCHTSLDVLDHQGQQIKSFTRYYILPVQNGTGGGLALASRDGNCPFYVMQENSQLSQGLALRFSPLDTKQPVVNVNVNVNVSSDINIVFNAATTCVQSTVWRLGGVDPVTGQRYVTSGGMSGRPGINTLNNWFKFEQYGDGNNNGYKIVFCPSVCSVCKVVCGDLGVFDENGKKWLGLSDDPLVVMFKKA